ncbi:MAG: nuclear transport factor 2 family protein [Bacteroidota bacterium]
MKKLLLLLFVTILFTGCQNEVRYTQTSPEIDVIKSHIDHYEKKNWEAWLSHYADTSKSFFNTKGPGLSASDALAALKEGVEGLSSYGFEQDDGDMEMIVDDQGRTWVNFWGNWKGTLKDGGETLEVPVHLTYQMIDSKIVREYGYWDNAPRLRAEMAAANKPPRITSAVMKRDTTKKKSAVMKKTEKKKVAKNKDAVMKKN